MTDRLALHDAALILNQAALHALRSGDAEAVALCAEAHKLVMEELAMEKCPTCGSHKGRERTIAHGLRWFTCAECGALVPGRPLRGSVAGVGQPAQNVNANAQKSAEHGLVGVGNIVAHLPTMPQPSLTMRATGAWGGLE